ncbi:MAG: phosphoribosylformylglycinamidine synthase subunit PurS [Myxococcota bacterium]
MRANVTVRLKAGVLDPQGEAVRQALGSLGFPGVNAVRVSKLVELEVEGDDPAAVRSSVEKMAAALLANPVIESYSVDVVEPKR